MLAFSGWEWADSQLYHSPGWAFCQSMAQFLSRTPSPLLS